MRWAVELPASNGGVAATVTVDAESWLGALTRARGGLALAKYHAEIENDGTVRVLDRTTRDRFTVRPMRPSGGDVGRGPSDPPLLFSSPPPADSPFSAARALNVPAPAAVPAVDLANMNVEGKATLLSHQPSLTISSTPPSAPLESAPATPLVAEASARAPAAPEAVTSSASSKPVREVSMAAPLPLRESPEPPFAKPVAKPVAREASMAAPFPLGETAERATASSPPATASSPPDAHTATQSTPPSSLSMPPIGARGGRSGRLRGRTGSHEVARVTIPPPYASEGRASTPPTESITPSRAEPTNGAQHENTRSDTFVMPTVNTGDVEVEPLPVPTVLFERDDEPTSSNPLVYRERVFAVPPGTRVERAEALARQSFAALKRSISSRPRGRFVTIAVFDHEFESHPQAPPLVVLRWKDWRGDPEVTFPPRDAPIIVAPIETPGTTTPPSAIATVPDIALAQEPAPAPVVAQGATPAPVVAEVAPVVTETGATMAETAPEVPAATAAPTPESAKAPRVEAKTPAADPSKQRGRRKRNRTNSESRVPATKAAPEAAAAVEPPRDAPAVVDAASHVPAATVVAAEPASAAQPRVEAPVVDSPVRTSPEAPPAETSSVSAEATPVGTVVAETVAVVTSSATTGVVESTPAPVMTTEPASAMPEAPTPVVEEAAPPADVSAPSTDPVVGPSIAPEVTAIEPSTTGSVRTSAALSGRRLRGKDLLSELFDSVMDLQFVQTADEACELAASVLSTAIVPDGCTVALYDIDRDEFVVACTTGEGTGTKGSREKATTGQRANALRRRGIVNLKRSTVLDSFGSAFTDGPALFAPAYHKERLFAMLVLQRVRGAPAFESDEEDGVSYVAAQLAEALSTHSRRSAAAEFSDEKSPPKRR